MNIYCDVRSILITYLSGLHVYIYIYVCVCVCVCVSQTEFTPRILHLELICVTFLALREMADHNLCGRIHLQAGH
jgi:hypothetical protein